MCCSLQILEGSPWEFPRETEIMLICRHAVLVTALIYLLIDKGKWDVNSCYTVVAVELFHYAVGRCSGK